MFPENRFMEILIIGALALIVVGPKDLPIMMRKVGQFVGKMRGMAAEFRASFDELARQSELEELRKEVEAMRVNQQAVMSTLNPAASPVFDDINQHLTDASTALAPSPVAEPVLAPPADPVEPVTAPAKPRTPRAPRAKAATAAKAPAKTASAEPARSRKTAKTASKTA